MPTELPTLLYIGTPEFAVAPLDALVQTGAYNILGVITQPDKPAGRGQKQASSAVKRAAIAHQLEVYQPTSLKGLTQVSSSTEERAKPLLYSEKTSQALFVEAVNALPPIDVIVSCAYGKIIPPALLQFAKHGVVNIHPSLLPRWRGAAPIQFALFSGDTTTGVCLMQAEEGLDTGPVFISESIPILAEEDCGSLHQRLAKFSSELLVKHLPEILAGRLTASPQQEQTATYAPKWGKEDLWIRWDEPAEVSSRRIRASSPYAGCRSLFREQLVKIFRARAKENLELPSAQPGEIAFVSKDELLVQAGANSYLAIEEMQFPGKKRLPIRELLKGQNFKRGETFSYCPPEVD